MATVQELKDQVAALQSDVTALTEAVNTEQDQVLAAIATLDQKIVDLQAVIDAGGTVTPADLQEIMDGVTSARDSIKTASDDLKSTIPEA